MVVNEPVNQTYAKLVLSDDAKTLLGGILVGDASAYGVLRPLVGEPLPGDPVALIAPGGSGGGEAGLGVGALPDGAQVCSCNTVTKGDLTEAIAGGCPTCRGEEVHPGRHLLRVLRAAAQAAAGSRGVEMSKALCEHFSQSRAELFEIVTRHRSSARSPG